jgi:hypothetical protein
MKPKKRFTVIKIGNAKWSVFDASERAHVSEWRTREAARIFARSQNRKEFLRTAEIIGSEPLNKGTRFEMMREARDRDKRKAVQLVQLKLLLLLATLAIMAATATAQEVRRAVPVEIRKAIPVTNETCWQWLKRTGNCTTGDCQGGHGSMAYMNWGDDTAPIYDNVEIEPDEVLVSAHPFREPSPSEPFFDPRAEQQIRARANDHGWIVSRLFRRGAFVGYIVWRPPVPMMVVKVFRRGVRDGRIEI